jgi:hypothetical protein
MATSSVRSFGEPLPEYLDWLAGAFIAVVGAALSIAGGAVLVLVDRRRIATGIGSGEISVPPVERTLTDAEATALATDVLDWTGIGLVATGLALIAIAVGFVVVRHRAHSRATETDPAASVTTAALFGAVTTTLLSFVPLSSVLGGGLAAYLAGPASDRPVGVGALSGVLAVAPAIAILTFVGIGLFVGLSGVQAGGIGALSLGLVCVAALAAVVYGAGLGALGGFLGSRLTGGR